mmetsp:Transcript_12732/g.34736  ORF Transcript_12732/g.34736 Transcript_12732/m.34736 type:complete len:244 (+) Transcript_12732:168-899(+)
MRNLPPCEAVRWQMQQTGATSCRWTRCLLGANTCLIHSRVSLVEAGVRRLLTTLRGLHEARMASITVPSLHGADSSLPASRAWLATAAAMAACARIGAAAPQRSRRVGAQSAAVAAEMYNHLLGLRSVLTRHRSAVLGPRPASAVPILSTCTSIASSLVVSARLRPSRSPRDTTREIRTARRTVPSLHGASSSRPTSRAWLAMAAAAAASVQIGAAAPRQSLSVGTRSAADVSIVIRECPPFR